MNYTAEILLRPQSELLAAWEWYEDKQGGLGDRFIKEVFDKIRQIEISPEHYPLRKNKFREARLKTFPYLVIFIINKRKKIIAVTSVFHTSRHPAKKYRSK